MAEPERELSVVITVTDAKHPEFEVKFSGPIEDFRFGPDENGKIWIKVANV